MNPFEMKLEEKKLHHSPVGDQTAGINHTFVSKSCCMYAAYVGNSSGPGCTFKRGLLLCSLLNACEQFKPISRCAILVNRSKHFPGQKPMSRLEQAAAKPHL